MTDIETPADPDILDLDTLFAEVNEERFPFRFGGEVYTLPSHPDLRAIGRLTTGDVAGAMSMLLGPEQYARFDASPATFDDRHLAALFERYGTNLGVGGVAGG